MDNLYSLSVVGIAGAYDATLSFDGDAADAAFGLRSIKKARDWGREAARIHRANSTPDHTEHYSESFTL